MRRLNTKGIRVEIEGTKLFVDNEELVPSVRRLGEMKDVLLTHGVINKANRDDPVYYMYRGIGYDRERAFLETELNYDITVIPRYRLGKEFNKTLGHYHPIAEKGLSYPELYEVIEGNALYIFQKRASGSGYLVDLIYANTGDKVLVPPNYGHVTANIGKKTLVMANLKNGPFKADYMSIVKMHGAAMYALSDGNLILNRNYSDVSVVVKEGRQMPRSIDSRKSLYDDFIANPKKFEFLNRPSLLKA